MEGFPQLGELEIFAVGIFYWVVGSWERVILTIRTFFKAKSSFCEYRTLIKIKISMTYMSKEYKVKKKGNCWWGNCSRWGGNEQIFGFFFWGGGDCPHSPVEKTLPTDQTLMENFDGSRKIPGGVSGGKVHFFSILTPLKQLKPQ